MADKKAPRRTIPAAEKAQTALDAATRTVTRLEKQQADLKGRTEANDADLASARKTRDYLAQHPALVKHTEPTLPDEDEPDSDGMADSDINS